MKNEFIDSLPQCLRNKKFGSVAKYWRERYFDAVERNGSDVELRQIFEAMQAEATKELKPVIPGGQPGLVFEDHSATLFLPGPDGAILFVCANYHLEIKEDS